VLAACATRVPPPAPALPETGLAPLVATSEIRGEFLMQQRLHFQWREQSGQVDAVVQMVCGELTVVLLSPFGTPGVVIHQRDRAVAVESKLPGPWSFPPEYILRDVERTYFVPLGERERGGEAIEEEWSGGRLVRRTFTGTRGGAPAQVAITYPDGMTRDDPPRRASIDAPQWGYRLDVETLSRVELTCPQ
jgi:hypothetical protein